MDELERSGCATFTAIISVLLTIIAIVGPVALYRWISPGNGIAGLGFTAMALFASASELIASIVFTLVAGCFRRHAFWLLSIQFPLLCLYIYVLLSF